MDHSEVVRLKAAEKYVLGELSADQREEFEEHYFDCAECVEDVKVLSTFVAASRRVFEEEAAAKVSAAKEPSEPKGWFRWLRPAVAAPAIGALAAVVIYQATVIIPTLRDQARTERLGHVYESSFRLQGTTRGGNTLRISVRANESFGLDFDFTPARSFPRYKGSLIDPSGRTALTFDVPGEEANKELHLVVPGSAVQPGIYELVFVGRNGTVNSDPRANEVQHLSFAVEIHP